MRYRQFEQLISPPRLTRFLLSCGNDTRKAMKLYRANIRLSQSFLATLGMFEVVYRNSIDNHYKAIYPAAAGGQHWLLASTLPGGFLTGTKCRKSFDKVTQAYAKLGGAYTPDKLVAELTLGFWKFMIAHNQYMAAGSNLLAIFPARPPRTNASTIYTKLDRINALRNRVAHHEPVCFGAGNTISTSYARAHFAEITDILAWMNINSSQLFYGLDGVIKECNYIDNI